MLGNEYQNLAMRTNDDLSNSRVAGRISRFCESMINLEDVPINPGELLNGALGLTGEAGEVADMIKKYFFHGHELNTDELIKELGDVMWYVALLCNALDISLDHVMTRNINKLKARYPEGFSEEASIKRVN